MFIVELKAVDARIPVEVRLRKWLKGALRQAGLRAISVKPAESDDGERFGIGTTDGTAGAGKRVSVRRRGE